MQAGICRALVRTPQCRSTSNVFLQAKRCKTEKASEKPQGIVIKQEEQKRKPVNYGVNWKGLKVTWNHLLTNVNHLISPKRVDAGDRYGKEDQVLYYFRLEDDLDHWYVETDEDVGGRSWAEFRQGSNGMTAVFRGYLNNAPPKSHLPSADPLQKRPIYRGFVYLETHPFRSFLNKDEFMSLHAFNMVKLRVRGDGRKYMFEAKCDVGADTQFMYVAPIYTNGGPLWQEIEIPYRKLVMMHNDVACHMQEGMEIHKISAFRFSLNDGMDGPFQLEVDYIALSRDPTFHMKGTDYYDPWTNVNTKSH